MSITNDTFSCAICANAYTKTGAHQPMAFECGHGSCENCITEMTKRAAVSVHCPSCRREVKAPVPNYDLIKQIGVATAQMIEQVKEHIHVMNLHDKELAKTTSKIRALQKKMVARAVKEISENPTDKLMLLKKARELVTLGIFDTVDHAQHALRFAINGAAPDNNSSQNPSHTMSGNAPRHNYSEEEIYELLRQKLSEIGASIDQELVTGVQRTQYYYQGPSITSLALDPSTLFDDIHSSDDEIYS